MNLPITSTLTIPNDFQLQGLQSVNFHRFAVAYGVTFPLLDLPDVAFRNDVKPLREKLRFEIRDKPIDKRWV